MSMGRDKEEPAIDRTRVAKRPDAFQTLSANEMPGLASRDLISYRLTGHSVCVCVSLRHEERAGRTPCATASDMPPLLELQALSVFPQQGTQFHTTELISRTHRVSREISWLGFK